MFYSLILGESMSESDTNKVKKIGSYTILITAGVALLSGSFTWLASTTVENKYTFGPIVAAIGTLNDNLEKQEERSITEQQRNRLHYLQLILVYIKDANLVL